MNQTQGIEMIADIVGKKLDIAGDDSAFGNHRGFVRYGAGILFPPAASGRNAHGRRS